MTSKKDGSRRIIQLVVLVWCRNRSLFREAQQGLAIACFGLSYSPNHDTHAHHLIVCMFRHVIQEKTTRHFAKELTCDHRGQML